MGRNRLDRRIDSDWNNIVNIVGNSIKNTHESGIDISNFNEGIPTIKDNWSTYTTAKAIEKKREINNQINELNRIIENLKEVIDIYKAKNDNEKYKKDLKLLYWKLDKTQSKIQFCEDKLKIITRGESLIQEKIENELKGEIERIIEEVRGSVNRQTDEIDLEEEDLTNSSPVINPANETNSPDESEIHDPLNYCNPNNTDATNLPDESERYVLPSYQITYVNEDPYRSAFFDPVSVSNKSNKPSDTQESAQGIQSNELESDYELNEAEEDTDSIISNLKKNINQSVDNIGDIMPEEYKEIFVKLFNKWEFEIYLNKHFSYLGGFKKQYEGKYNEKVERINTFDQFIELLKNGTDNLSLNQISQYKKDLESFFTDELLDNYIDEIRELEKVLGITIKDQSLCGIIMSKIENEIKNNTHNGKINVDSEEEVGEGNISSDDKIDDINKSDENLGEGKINSWPSLGKSIKQGLNKVVNLFSARKNKSQAVSSSAETGEEYINSEDEPPSQTEETRQNEPDLKNTETTPKEAGRSATTNTQTSTDQHRSTKEGIGLRSTNGNEISAEGVPEELKERSRMLLEMFLFWGYDVKLKRNEILHYLESCFYYKVNNPFISNKIKHPKIEMNEDKKMINDFLNEIGINHEGKIEKGISDLLMSWHLGIKNIDTEKFDKLESILNKIWGNRPDYELNAGQEEELSRNLGTYRANHEKKVQIDTLPRQQVSEKEDNKKQDSQKEEPRLESTGSTTFSTTKESSEKGGRTEPNITCSADEILNLYSEEYEQKIINIFTLTLTNDEIIEDLLSCLKGINTGEEETIRDNLKSIGICGSDTGLEMHDKNIIAIREQIIIVLAELFHYKESQYNKGKLDLLKNIFDFFNVENLKPEFDNNLQDQWAELFMNYKNKQGNTAQDCLNEIPTQRLKIANKNQVKKRKKITFKSATLIALLVAIGGGGSYKHKEIIDYGRSALERITAKTKALAEKIQPSNAGGKDDINKRKQPTTTTETITSKVQESSVVPAGKITVIIKGGGTEGKEEESAQKKEIAQKQPLESSDTSRNKAEQNNTPDTQNFYIFKPCEGNNSQNHCLKEKGNIQDLFHIGIRKLYDSGLIQNTSNIRSLQCSSKKHTKVKKIDQNGWQKKFGFRPPNDSYETITETYCLR